MDRNQRYLTPFIEEDLQSKMVFLGGPRQSGKTTLSLNLLKNGSKEHPAYLNWDAPPARKKILNLDFSVDQPLLIFDEIHKYKKWRNLIKGVFDTLGSRHQILVTGSARLDYYRRGGDSLQGRYHYYRLHPLSLLEISKNPTKDDLQQLLKLGGFPEPFLKGSERSWRRWQNERMERVVNEDVRDLENVREISLLQVLSSLLPDRVGAPLSLQALRNDLEVSHESIRKWVDIFDHLYYSFRIPPYGVSTVKAVKKEQKLYLWDWSLVEQPGFRFENLVASQLLKYCHFRQDTEGYKMELRYLRDVQKREIDFVVIQDKKPLFAVECKTGERELSSAIEYFAPRTPIPIFYQVHLGSTHRVNKIAGKDVVTIPFLKWVKEMKFP
jgi:predicted AAA+ superfamily ATPase